VPCDRGHHVQQSAVGECRYGHEVKHDLAAGAEWNRCLASGNPDDTIGSKGGDALGDPRRTSALKIPLDRVPSDVRIERPRRVILKLPLPGVDLVGTDLVALGEVVDRRLLSQRLRAIFAPFSPASIRCRVFFVIVRSV
jgi:hypothetical protein